MDIKFAKKVGWGAIVLTGGAAYVTRIADKSASAYDYLTVLGTVISVYGLVVVVWQMVVLAKTAKTLKETLEKARNEFFQRMTFHDYGMCIGRVDEIVGCVKGKLYDAAVIRLKDLRTLLMRLDVNQDGKQREELTNHQAELSRWIKDIESKQGRGKEFKVIELLQSLDLIRSDLERWGTDAQKQGNNNGY